jgi:hypothetical protein
MSLLNVGALFLVLGTIAVLAVALVVGLVRVR